MSNLESLSLLLTSALTNTISEIKTKEWPDILNEMKNHAVFCIPYKNVMKSEISKEEKDSYRALCLQNIYNSTRVLTVQNVLVSLLQNNKIPFVVIKGYSAAIYYDDPILRCMGDIDIMVSPTYYRQTYDLLCKHYKVIGDGHPRHASFLCSQGVEIELHKRFSYGEETEQNKLLDEILYNGIDQAEYHNINGESFPVLPAQENGLVLLYHIYQHMLIKGIGLRQIIDFRKYAEKNEHELNAFLSLAEKVSLRALAETLLFICCDFLGLDSKVKLLCHQCDKNISDSLYRYIYRKGNFGVKDHQNDTNRIANVMVNFRNPIKGLIQLQKYGRIHWKKTDKYWILRPFAWVYQINYYIRKNHSLKAIRVGTSSAIEESTVFNALGIRKTH